MLPQIIIVSILLCLVLTGLITAGKFTIFKREDDVKILPLFVIMVGFILTLYILSIVCSIILLFINLHYLYGTIFVLFLLFPFIIGYFSNYKRIKIFLNIQIVELLIGLMVSLFIVASIT